MGRVSASATSPAANRRWSWIPVRRAGPRRQRSRVRRSRGRRSREGRRGEPDHLWRTAATLGHSASSLPCATSLAFGRWAGSGIHWRSARWKPAHRRAPDRARPARTRSRSRRRNRRGRLAKRRIGDRSAGAAADKGRRAARRGGALSGDEPDQRRKIVLDTMAVLGFAVDCGEVVREIDDSHPIAGRGDRAHGLLKVGEVAAGMSNTMIVPFGSPSARTIATGPSRPASGRSQAIATAGHQARATTNAAKTALSKPSIRMRRRKAPSHHHLAEVPVLMFCYATLSPLHCDRPTRAEQ